MTRGSPKLGANSLEGWNQRRTAAVSRSRCDGLHRAARTLVFVDIGAHDGVSLSNTAFFEHERAWSGVCIEPNPAVFPNLASHHSVPTLNVAVGATEGTLPFLQVSGHGEMLSGLAASATPEHKARIERETRQHGGSYTTMDVPVRRLDNILAEHGIEEVHYLSIDTEGAGLSVLESLDFNRVFVHVVDVECNERAQDKGLTDALPGFARIRHRHDLFFVNRESPFSARVKRLQRAVWRYAAQRRAAKLFGTRAP